MLLLHSRHVPQITLTCHSAGQGSEGGYKETGNGWGRAKAISPKGPFLPNVASKRRRLFAHIPDITSKHSDSDEDSVCSIVKVSLSTPDIVRENLDGVINAFVPSHPTKPEEYSNEFFEIKESRFGGRGAFAKKDLKEGEIILAERALFKSSKTALYDDLEKLKPEHRAAYNRLHAFRRMPNADLSWSIFITNSFDIKPQSCVYLVAARFNHACRPANSVTYWISDTGSLIVFYMSKDVEAGTELCISYGLLSPLELYTYWGFRCACGGCTPLTDAEITQWRRERYRC
ncbi:hypothetical protein F5B20DRAFT_274398 [Whalleya microplaca]|nr:hypothetical protein F5B20DRAFT_274398 [Whalleya microplaca]